MHISLDVLNSLKIVLSQHQRGKQQICSCWAFGRLFYTVEDVVNAEHVPRAWLLPGWDCSGAWVLHWRQGCSHTEREGGKIWKPGYPGSGVSSQWTDCVCQTALSLSSCLPLRKAGGMGFQTVYCGAVGSLSSTICGGKWIENKNKWILCDNI